jgi:RNA polymerase sigma-70 factor (ECF subfamily)
VADDPLGNEVPELSGDAPPASNARLRIEGRDFPPTQWSQLVALQDGQAPQRAAILERLARRYWRPVYYYVRALRPVSPADAQDLTQQFFARLLSGGRLSSLSPERGSFRGFLKTALRNFVVNAHDGPRARARLVFAFDEADAAWPGHGNAGPEEAFDRAWAQTVLDEALARLKEELAFKRKELQYELFAAYCLGDEEVTQKALAARFSVTEAQVEHHLAEARRRLRRAVQQVLREQVGAGKGLEEELKLILIR